MTNREKLIAAIDARLRDPKFSWVRGELEHFQTLNEERDEADKLADDAEIFMADLADKEDEEDTSPAEKRQIRKILIAAGFYAPFDEKSWKEGKIVTSRGKPWSFSLDGVKYDSAYTYFDFLD